jgi:Leucine-rich repeat (LRR) protein
MDNEYSVEIPYEDYMQVHHLLKSKKAKFIIPLGVNKHPKFPKDLIEVHCYSRSIKYLEGITRNTNLRVLNCYCCSLTQLPELPESLEVLECRYNRLIQLPRLPKNLILLNCGGNQLIELPKLPKSLKELYCDESKLTELPELPESLEYLDCSFNQLTRLPRLPKKLKELKCSYNKLTMIPRLPESLDYLDVRDSRTFDFGDICPMSNIDLYRKYHNALIDFQRHFRCYLQRKITLKERCKITIKNSSDKIKVIELSSSIIPQELIEYLNFK